jgi:hypothetical protein
VQQQLSPLFVESTLGQYLKTTEVDELLQKLETIRGPLFHGDQVTTYADVLAWLFASTELGLSPRQFGAPSPRCGPFTARLLSTRTIDAASTKLLLLVHDIYGFRCLVEVQRDNECLKLLPFCVFEPDDAELLKHRSPSSGGSSEEVRIGSLPPHHEEDTAQNGRVQMDEDHESSDSSYSFNSPNSSLSDDFELGSRFDARDSDVEHRNLFSPDSESDDAE